MLRRFSLLFILLVSSFSVISITQAQTYTTPLLMMLDGDIWAWDGPGSEIRQLTDWEFQQEMSISPDGRQVAYTSYPTVVVDAIHRLGGFGGGALPSNIWLMDVLTGDAVRLVDQPANASFFTDGVPDNVMVRSTPAWSPDGTKLAYTEYNDNSGPEQLTVYDLATGTSETIATNLPMQYGVTDPMPVMWGRAVIVLISDAISDTSPSGFDRQLLVFRPNGEPVTTIGLTMTEERHTENLMLMDYNGIEYMGVLYNTGESELVNLLSGEIQPMPALPEMYSPLAPDAQSAITIIPNIEGSPFFDTVNSADKRMVFHQRFIHNDMIALSPDGQAVAYQPLDADNRFMDEIHVTTGSGQPVERILIDPETVNNIDSFVWGPTAWRIPSDGSPIVSRCPDALAARLTIGGKGVVVPGSGSNNVRSEPSRSASLIGEIPENANFEVIGGPTCADGLLWWNINYNGLIGWTVEGADGIYYLQPVE